MLVSESVLCQRNVLNFDKATPLENKQWWPVNGTCTGWISSLPLFKHLGNALFTLLSWMRTPPIWSRVWFLLKIDPLSQKKTTISKKISSLGLFHVFLQPHVSFLHLRNVWNVCVFILKPPPPPQNALRMAAMYDNITDNNAEFLASQKNGFVLVFSWLVRERKIWYVSNYIYR